MPHSKLSRKFIILLLLSSVLSIIPSGSSQQFTTTTTFVTSAMTQTGVTGSFSFGFTASTGTTALQRAMTFRSYTGALCYLSLGEPFINFTGTTRFEYTVSSPMTLYVVSASIPNLMIAFAVLAEAYTSGCNGQLSLTGDYAQYNSWIFQKSLSGSGTFDLSMPQQGNPYMWALVVPMTGYPTASIAIGNLLTTYTNTQMLSSWIPFGFTMSSTTTLTSSTVLEIPFTQTYGGWIIAVIIGVVVIGGLIVALRKRSVTHRPKQATLTEFSKAIPFCVKCGSQLPPTSEFCNKCGTKQPL